MTASAPAGDGPRILFVSTVYPTPWEPHKGPANLVTVQSLRALGCDVAVVAPVPWTRKLARRQLVTPAEAYPTYWYPPRLARDHYHQTMAWSIDRTLDRVADRAHPQAVLAFWTDPDGTVALAAARRLGVPCGIIAGGSDLMLLPRDPARRRVISNTLRGADHIFAVGSTLQRKAVAFGAIPEHVSNFLCGVDAQRFTPGNRAAARTRLGLHAEGPLLLWIGQMVRVKAVERLLAAAARLRPEFPGLHVALVGSGPERTALAALVDAEPTLRDAVSFAGAIDHDALPDWYRAADVFVLPSRSEGVPTVLLEALATSLPFVASDVGSIADLLPFGPSRIAPEGDTNALALEIGAVLRDRSGRPAPRVIDRLDGARHLLRHLGLQVPV